MLKHTQTYEIMTLESIGVKQTSLVVGASTSAATPSSTS